MIHIIGTDRFFQVSTAPRRAGAGKDGLIKFQAYLARTARRLDANMIAEEANLEWVMDQGPEAWSVAQRVAEQTGIRHRFCDPNSKERREIGLKTEGELWDKANAISSRTHSDVVEVWKEEVRSNFQAREDFWLRRLKVRSFMKMTTLFVCAAEHADTFKLTSEASNLRARIHCRCWPNHMKSNYG
jgi:hypothetical protein